MKPEYETGGKIRRRIVGDGPTAAARLSWGLTLRTAGAA